MARGWWTGYEKDTAPVHTLIYTHGHFDHVGGMPFFGALVESFLREYDVIHDYGYAKIVRFTTFA